MNEYLAQLYGTPGAPTEEDQEKVAQAELFAKLAADNNIDLNNLTDDQIGDLWEGTFGKEAMGDKAEEATADEYADKVEEKEKKKNEATEKAMAEEQKEGAAHEFLEKKAAQDKLAEADYLGRVMAHSYVQELQKIAAAEEGAPEEKVAEEQTASSSTSSIDGLAVQEAVKIAAASDYDAQEAIDRINAVATLGINESTKIAAASSPEEAVQVRALEFLEAAGYPVEWNQG
jgi:hypothetical protein